MLRLDITNGMNYLSLYVWLDYAFMLHVLPCRSYTDIILYIHMDIMPLMLMETCVYHHILT